MSAAAPAELPRIAQLKPCYTELKKGDVVFWCACGRSQRQPFCDGSHRDTAFRPLRYEAQQDEELLLCACKRSGNAPHCDGSHNALVGRYGTDDALSDANRRIAEVTRDADSKARLDGGCFVCTVAERPAHRQGALAWRSIIDNSDGARYQAQFMFEVSPGDAPVVGFGDRHVALLVAEGRGHVCIGGRPFAVSAVMGAYARPGESIVFEPAAGEHLRVFASVGPVVDAPSFGTAMPSTFDNAHPERTVALDAAQRQTMAERYFQMLVDRRHGSTLLTQFIGEIPRSKAVPHRHLYEESLIVVAGEGMMWTESKKAAVHGGDVIFLPRKQLHSLECTSEAPMLVAGVIYPGDNPAINYYD